VSPDSLTNIFLTGIISELGRAVTRLRSAATYGVRPEPAAGIGVGRPYLIRRAANPAHPEMLGRAFQVIALEKSDPEAPRLAGFKFAH
jgi:hypothetical protein